MTHGGVRIAASLAQAAAAGRPAMAAYVTAGYPARRAFPGLVHAVGAACDVLEVGIPFSDPMADGATIQRASRISLLEGTTLTFTLDALAEVIPSVAAPVVLMSYMNPLLAYGVVRVARDAADAGVCGFVVPDLPVEEQDLLAPHLRRAGLALIQMVTPTTPEERLRRIGTLSEGFVYAVTVAGTTGGSVVASSALEGYLARVRASTEHPILAGFGVRSRDDIAALVPPADGVVVGSALIDAIDRGESPGDFLFESARSCEPDEGGPSMIAILSRSCSLKEKADVIRRLESDGYRVTVGVLGDEAVVGVLGTAPPSLEALLSAMPGVRETRRDVPPYALVARAHHPETTRVKLGNAAIGGREIVVIAGPCSIESEAQIRSIARSVAAAGARMLRGGAFKPRTSPYGFQGLGEEGLRLLAAAGEEVGLPVVSEVVGPEDVDLVARHVDVLQIGARSMQNFRLLAACGRQPKPVLLKRSPMATIDEYLNAAEYVMTHGNPRVILCERGIRTFETATRNTLDVSAVPVLRGRTHLPIVVDPSHAAGRREWVPALALAAVAAGADGLLVEVHDDPDAALSDGRQSLTCEDFDAMMGGVRRVADAVDRDVSEVRGR